MSTTLTFCNGTDGATGSEFLLEREGYTFLVDCGLIQGNDNDAKRNAQEFSYNPSDVDILFVTHAHMDHIGRIPKLVSAGFHGVIYSTEPTKALAEVMFQDALNVMSILEKEEGIPPLYNQKDVIATLSHWETKPLYTSFIPLQGCGINVQFKDAGHILGSSMIELRSDKGSILFTGDLGNTPHELLRDTDSPGNVDYIVTESVYGDRNHESKEHRLDEFAEIIKDTINHKGTLLIPVFSLERSQDILFDLNRLIESNKVPHVPVFLDSPLAIDITNIYKKFTHWLNDSVQQRIKEGDNIFEFPGLFETYTQSESKEINTVEGSKIILAGSGMSHGGRIQHHEIRHLSNPNNTILFVGYQMPGSIGRRIIDGTKSVTIYNKKVKVRAHVEHIFSYSAHKDSDHIQDFISSGTDLKQVFIVLGEHASRVFLAQRLHEYFGIKSILPELKESFQIEL